MIIDVAEPKSSVRFVRVSNQQRALSSPDRLYDSSEHAPFFIEIPFEEVHIKDYEHNGK